MRLVMALGLAVVACAAPAAQPTASLPAAPLAVVDLKYRVFDQVGRPWYCDPDFYPIQREDEAVAAERRLPEIQGDAETYAAILRHNGLASAPVTADQKLAVYRDWKQLATLELQPVGDVYGFAILVQGAPGAKEGSRVEGRIDRSGRITILRKDPSGPPMCPICLIEETLIDTPSGPRPVTELRVGDVVWTLDDAGRRIAVPLVRTGSMAAPAGHEVVRLTLADGRAVTASPGHPTADGRRIGSLRLGEALDGATVVAIDRLPYRGRTYDVLPAGPTGIYLAQGVPLGSTIR
jgi:hypothetical protein